MGSERVPVTIDPGGFASVVLRARGDAVRVLTGPSTGTRVAVVAGGEQPQGPWIPGPLPPPAQAIRVFVGDEPLASLLERGIEALDDYLTETSPQDVDAIERAGPGATLVIRIYGTNLVDFDDEDLGRQLSAAQRAGADVVVQLVE